MAVQHQSGGKSARDNDNGKGDPNGWWNRITPSVFTHTTPSDVEQEVRIYDDLYEGAEHATGKLIVQSAVAGRKFRKVATMKFDSLDEFGELADFFVAVKKDLG